ncbi:dihydropteroate synthase [Janibacter sp. G56]|uniref:dihydropteroate synthase n=1 Tax=Janibacter sp. G56 TaxID=3418717 RepID=UPI003CFC4703
MGARPAPLVLRGRTFDAAHPAVMAIINRTSDSFFAGGRHAHLDDALAALGRAVDDGADLIDVGAVRAGQEGEHVSAEMEIDRLTPFVLEARRQHPDVILSIDTWRSEVVRALALHGIDVVNDTWAGHDPELVAVAAEIGAGIVCSHTGGLPPRTDPVGVTYPPEPDGVVKDVVATLRAAAERALAAGIPGERILLDPTLDFGKTTRHSLTLVRHTADVVALGHPVLQAISRKDFVGETLDLPVEDRLHGTLAATAISAWLGATVFRAHDVRATRETLDMVASIGGWRPPAVSRRGEPA